MRRLIIIPLVFTFALSSGQITQGGKANIKVGVFGTNVIESDFNMIFQQDLDHRDPGPYGWTPWQEDWNQPLWANGITTGDRTVIVDYEGGGRSSRVMRWIFPEGTFSANADHGYQWNTPLGADYYETYLTYSVMFRPGFDPVQGGKLPCLLGYPDEEQDPEDKFYAGLMFKEGPKPVFYVYHHDKPGEYGDTRYWDYDFDVSQEIWYDITLRVVMNSVSNGTGNKDGLLEGYVNGKLVGQWPNIRLRNHEDIGTDAAVIQAFFGGGDDSWATKRDEWMLIDNVSVWQYSTLYLDKNPSVPRGSQQGNYGDMIITPIDLLDGIPDPDPDPDDPDVDVDPPSAPTGLIAIDSTQSTISITWDSSKDNVGVEGYYVFRDGFMFGATISNGYVFAKLKPSTVYNFYVKAYDAAGNISSKSSTESASTRLLDTIVPTAPTNLRPGRISGYFAEILWDVATDNVGVSHYDIFVNGGQRHSTAETLFIIPSLEPNIAYNISVKAVDVSGNVGPFSNVINIETGEQDEEPPSKPTELRENFVTETTVNFSWKPSVDNVMVSKYKIYMNGQEWDESTLNERTIAGLEPGLPYSFTVRAYDEAMNESPLSDPLVISTKNQDITTSPTLPEISILDVRKNTNNPSTLTEMSALGYVETSYFGIEVSETEKEEDQPWVMDGVNSSVYLSSERVGNGIQVLYIFSEGEGDIVKDWAEVSTSMDLLINREGITTEWLNGQGLKILDKTSISYPETPTRLINALKETNEVTIEAWIKQEQSNQGGFAQLVSIFKDPDSLAISLSHNGNEASYKYEAMVNTSATGPNGFPIVESNNSFVSNSLHHLVFTRDNQGLEKIYINGLEFYSGVRSGDFSSWDDDYTFSLVANENLNENPWRGIYYMVAVYNKAFKQEDVIINYRAGIGRVQYTNFLGSLEDNVEYNLTPFVRTNQGTVYGDAVPYINRNVTRTDSTLVLYPNPNFGYFTLIVRNKNTDINTAYLRIADFTGQIHFNREIDLSESLYENIFQIELPPEMAAGFYSVIFIAGTYSVAEKLVLLR